VVTPEQRRTAVTSAMLAAEVSERRACRYTGFARSSQRYQVRRLARTELRERLHTLATLRPRWGYRRLYVLLRREDLVVNRKLLQRSIGKKGCMCTVENASASRCRGWRFRRRQYLTSAGAWTSSRTPWATGGSFAR
jgi:putative transposase